MGTGSVTERQQNGLFMALSHPRRRAILSLLDRFNRMKLEELATHLVAEERGTSLLDVTHDEAEQVLRTLEHVHLPELVEQDLVTQEDGMVTTTQHPALQDPKIMRMLETEAADWDEVLACLADRRRRIVLTTLYMEDGPIDRTELAMEVAKKTRSHGDQEVSVEYLLQRLHHVHLPKLDAAGLITYDVGEATATYDGHPTVDEEWLIAGDEDTPRSILSMAHRSGDIWTLEGRDNVSERGRALCESAEEELFMMFTVRGAVETTCLRRIQDALERGVDVYLGTQNKELRDLVRTRAPEVTIWEPQLDWLNLPPRREKIGRLIFADREELLIGTIGEEAPDGVPRETAITGTGEDNPLVVLLREMLGSRLDHLDTQSEDFRSERPL